MPGCTAPPRWKYTLGLLLKVGSKVVYKLVSSGRMNKPGSKRQFKVTLINKRSFIGLKKKRNLAYWVFESWDSYLDILGFVLYVLVSWSSRNYPSVWVLAELAIVSFQVVLVEAVVRVVDRNRTGALSSVLENSDTYVYSWAVQRWPMQLDLLFRICFFMKSHAFLGRLVMYMCVYV